MEKFKYILLFFFVLILGIGQLESYSSPYQNDIYPVSEESVLYSTEEEHPITLDNVSIIPSQISVPPKIRVVFFRINSILKFLFCEEQNENVSFFTRTKSALICWLFVSSEKQECGYYIYNLRRIII